MRTGHVELNHDLHASAAAIFHELLHIGPGILLRVGVRTVPQPASAKNMDRMKCQYETKNNTNNIC